MTFKGYDEWAEQRAWHTRRIDRVMELVGEHGASLVSQRSGVARITIYQWGKGTGPSVRSVERILSAFSEEVD